MVRSRRWGGSSRCAIETTLPPFDLGKGSSASSAHSCSLRREPWQASLAHSHEFCRPSDDLFAEQSGCPLLWPALIVVYSWFLWFMAWVHFRDLIYPFVGSQNLEFTFGEKMPLFWVYLNGCIWSSIEKEAAPPNINTLVMLLEGTRPPFAKRVSICFILLEGICGQMGYLWNQPQSLFS